MQDRVNPALAACLYSLILIATAFVMARRGRGSTPSGADLGAAESAPVLRGTAVALCAVAILLPMVRVIGTTSSGDLMLLGGAMLAGGAAMVHLMRTTPNQEPPAARVRRPARHEIMPARTPPARTPPARTLPAGDPVGLSARKPEPSLDPQATTDHPVDLRGGRDGDPWRAGESALPGGPAPELAEHASDSATPEGRASRTLDEVESVIEDFAHRLRLDTDGEPGLAVGPGTTGDRTGNDRTGNDRTGNDRTGNDHTGRSGHGRGGDTDRGSKP